MAVDYSAWTTTELLEEIRREQEALVDFRRSLTEAESRRKEIEAAIEEERLVYYEERVRKRASRIKEVRGWIEERRTQIRQVESRIRERAETISYLESRIAALTARLPFLSPVERYITRETIRRSHRTISALKGWQTRNREYSAALRGAQATDIGTLGALSKWQIAEATFLERLTTLREALERWITEITRLREIIVREEARLETKREYLPKRLLYRIKVRLYNFERLPTPTGQFQGFFDIDAVIDPETELVDWDFWLTIEEIAIAKYHFVGYFKGMAKWRSPEQVSLAYFDEPTGIPHETERVRYKYSKKVPEDFILKAETLTVGELIVGESSVEPEPNVEPTAENMGVFVQRFMIIDKDGAIKWDELRQRHIWHPTEDMVNRVKEELKIA